MENKDESYAFPWGFHLGDLHKEKTVIPLYTNTKDGGFCLLYDKTSERKADEVLEGLCLELLTTMPHKSLKVEMFDFGRKKFYHLSPLQYIELYSVYHNTEMINNHFDRLEKLIISRHTDLLCCNRKTIDEHNQKSKMKQMYHLMLINLNNFPTVEQDLRRIQNFVESASQAGMYIIAFGNLEIEESSSETTQAILKHLKTLRVRDNHFEITPEIFEFMELLEDHQFKSLAIDKPSQLQKIMTNADLETLLDPESIKLETDTKVK
jgi:hypothetical protein